jgi:hypothetical protein
VQWHETFVLLLAVVLPVFSFSRTVLTAEGRKQSSILNIKVVFIPLTLTIASNIAIHLSLCLFHCFMER